MNKLNMNVQVYYPLFFQIMRFGIVGVSAATVHFCVVIGLVQEYFLPPLIANIFGFVIAFQVSYWGHRLWTFYGTDVEHRVAFPKLLLVQLIALTANESLFYSLLSFQLPYQLALFIVLTILPIFTFISSKLWVFK